MIRSLAGLCVLLLGVIAVEVVGHADPGHPAAPGPSSPLRIPPAAMAGVTDVVDPRWLTEVLARPLFAPDRKPAAGAASSTPGLPRLAGIIATPEGNLAIFQPEGEAKQVLARHGERVAGWQVSAIGPEAVTLQKAGERVVLSPRFAPAAGGSVPPSQPFLPLRH